MQNPFSFNRVVFQKTFCLQMDGWTDRHGETSIRRILLQLCVDGCKYTSHWGFLHSPHLKVKRSINISNNVFQHLYEHDTILKTSVTMITT